jgi:hypothetical protein
MVERRIIHGRGFIEILLRDQLHFVSLRRICYLISSHRTRWPKLPLSHPAHAKFVICDCTIENRLHYRRDVTLGEDACQVRLAGAPEALAALNGGVLALLDWLGVPNAASALRHFCAHPGDALQLLYGKLLR